MHLQNVFQGNKYVKGDLYSALHELHNIQTPVCL